MNSSSNKYASNPMRCIDGLGHRFSVADDFRSVHCDKCWMNPEGDSPTSVTTSWKVRLSHSARRSHARQERFYAVVAWLWIIMAVGAGILGQPSTCYQFVTIGAISAGVSAILRRLREVSE